MTTDNESVVQEGAVSEGTPSEASVEEPQSQPSVEEVLRQVESEKQARAKAEELARRFQSEKDRTESRLKAMERQLQEVMPQLDEDSRQTLETADVRRKLSYYEEQERQRETERQQEEFLTHFTNSLREAASDMGIDANDKRLDWGEGASNLLEARRRFDKSVATIIKDDRAKMEADIAKKVEGRLREKFGDVEIDTGGPSGKADKEFLKAYAAGEVNDHERARKLLDEL